MVNNTPTPHNNAKYGDFAETCVICGDPVRSKYIADKYLTNKVLVNNIRGVQGYTGYYKDKKISVMAHGMGIPSISIYVYELFNFYGVKNIIRLGTAGTLNSDIKLGSMLIATSAVTTSNFVEQFGYDILEEFNASKKLVKLAKQTVKKQNEKILEGQIVTTEVFYDKKSNLEKFRDMGALAVEMEIAALYLLAKECGKNALALLNITDNPIDGGWLSAEDRVNLMDKLIELVLEIAINA